MQKPSINKEITGRIFPPIEALGFKRAGGKCFARVSPEIIQLLFLHVRTGLRREFMIEYCAMLAFEPHLHPSLGHGGRFPVKSPRGIWYRADSEESLARSCTKMEEDLPTLLEWFQASATLEGFIDSYAVRLEGESEGIRRNGHSSFTLACGSAAKGDLVAASSHLLEASEDLRSGYQSFIAEVPGADHWAPERLERCEELAAAIREERIEPLFKRWRDESLAILKLSP